MYDFIDVTETAENNILPSEAMKLNGEYIENQIKGYRTLHVSGREAISPELNYYETGVRDGSALKSKRFPARTIVITYQLAAGSSEEFREAYNKLGFILNVKDAELIFNDEPDRYYTGTPSLIGEVEPGRNTVTGEIEIFCADPFKYSLIEYEAQANLDANSVLIDYNGTYKAFPTLEADFYKESDVTDDGSAGTLTGKGDCGYVAFFTEDEQIIQLGDPEEVDGEQAYQPSQTLVNQLFTGSSSWGSTAKGLWSVNSGDVLPGGVQQMGNVGMCVASYAVHSTPPDTSGEIFRGMSDGDQPPFNYTVVARAYGRTETSIKVDYTITASMKNKGSYFGRGFGLVAGIWINGWWYEVTLKEKTEYWRGRTAHTVSLSIPISGLTGSTSAIENVWFRVNRSDSVGGGAGIVTEKICSNLAISTYIADEPETYYLAPSDFGSASGSWHGAAITRKIPADSAQEVGAKDFTLTYKQKMSIGSSGGSSGQMGAFQVNLSDSAGKSVAGVRIHKNNAGTSASLLYYLDGEKVYGTTIDLSYNNAAFGSKENAVQTSTITKSGNKVTFTVGGNVRTFTSDKIAKSIVAKITFVFEKYSSSPVLSYNGLYWAKFVKNNCETYKDIPNKFSANDIVVADCKKGEIRLNGVLTPGLGALGNDWETFILTPGLNQIGVACSEWVPEEYKPTYKVRYREVFL